MSMKESKSVLLRYSNKNRIKFQRYAEFFRLIGVCVCESLSEDGDSLRLERGFYNAEYDLDTPIKLKSLKEFWFDGEDYTYQKLRNVYRNNHLLQAAVTLQYFYMNSPVVEVAGEHFKEAADELDEFYWENEYALSQEYEIQYARLYCKQKVNLAQYLRHNQITYPVETLAEECVALRESFPMCENTSVLLGLIYEISPKHKMDAIEAFLDACSAMENKPYVSSVLYRLGKICEETVSLRNLMDSAYHKAYEEMPKYRNIYKVARHFMETEQWNWAIVYLKECISKIELRKQYLDPLEQEYYFKVHSHLAYIYIKQRDFVSVIESANDALAFRRDVEKDMYLFISEDQFYNEMYALDRKGKWEDTGFDPQEMVRTELKRMAPDNVYKYLGTAYKELGMDEVAEKYRNMQKENA